MTLDIENKDVEKFIEEIMAMRGESKTEAVRKALEVRRDRLIMDTFGAGRRRNPASFPPTLAADFSEA